MSFSGVLKLVFFSHFVFERPRLRMLVKYALGFLFGRCLMISSSSSLPWKWSWRWWPWGSLARSVTLETPGTAWISSLSWLGRLIISGLVYLGFTGVLYGTEMMWLRRKFPLWCYSGAAAKLDLGMLGLAASGRKSRQGSSAPQLMCSHLSSTTSAEGAHWYQLKSLSETFLGFCAFNMSR